MQQRYICLFIIHYNTEKSLRGLLYTALLSREECPAVQRNSQKSPRVVGLGAQGGGGERGCSTLLIYKIRLGVSDVLHGRLQEIQYLSDLHTQLQSPIYIKYRGMYDMYEL